MHVTKRIDLDQLARELTAAGVPFNALGHDGTDEDGELFTYAEGAPDELPPAAAPVVAAHVPESLPAINSQRLTIATEKVTVGAAASILYRYPMPTNTGFNVYAIVIAIDMTGGAGTGNVRKWERKAFIKRLAGAPALVGAVSNPLGASDVQDAGAASWTMTPTFSGNDLVFSVTGAAGRTIHWSLLADVLRFTPAT